MLPKVREWLNVLETAKLPRTPTTTNAMPLSAIAAVQRAAEVRLSSLEQAGPHKEVTLRLPPSALFREGARSATDIQPVEGLSGPQLGDRIANICADGVPFGARGTVVSVHSSVHGCVEVVMDEEFIGGSNLQGSCKNFRGKLCLWAHLLKISASDSAEIVEQMIPAGSATEKIKALKIVQHPEALHEENANGDKAEVEAQRSEKIQHPSKPSGADGLKTPTEVKKKQGTWREAKGPQGGKGFKGARRGGKSGYTAWKQHVSRCTLSSSKGDISRASKRPDNLDSSVKAAPLPEKQSAPRVNLADAAADLKTFLGVSASPSNDNVARPTTATDALMSLMIGDAKQPTAVPTQINAPKFNFTYVQEGHEGQQSAASKRTMQDPHVGTVAPVAANAPYPVAHPMMPYPSHLPGFMPYSMPPSYPLAPPVVSSASVVPRTKKASGKVINGDAKNQDKIIPSVVVSKVKK